MTLQHINVVEWTAKLTYLHSVNSVRGWRNVLGSPRFGSATDETCQNVCVWYRVANFQAVDRAERPTSFFLRFAELAFCMVPDVPFA